MARIFTDFDGPIMDVSERYYRVYRDCLEMARDRHQTVTPLSKAEFWRLKRAQVAERHIGERSGLHADQARQFAQLRWQRIHNPTYLHHDRVWPQAIPALTQMQSLGYDLVVVTMRRDKTLHQVLATEGLGEFFPLEKRYCLPDEYLKASDVEEKPRLLATALAQLPPCSDNWMIGDTEADIIAAHTHRVPVVAVLSGIRDRDRLAAHEPTAIVATLKEAVNFIQATPGQTTP